MRVFIEGLAKNIASLLRVFTSSLETILWQTELSEPDTEYLKIWEDVPAELILYAAEITAERIEIPSVRYADAIIKNWQLRGI